MSSLARALFLSLLVSTHRPRPARQRRSTGSAEARLCRCTDWFNKGRMVREREREPELVSIEAAFTALLLRL